jgi:hypothetical protein
MTYEADVLKQNRRFEVCLPFSNLTNLMTNVKNGQDGRNDFEKTFSFLHRIFQLLMLENDRPTHTSVTSR